MRFFNTAGPVRRDLHYCLPSLERINLEDVLMLIQQQKYFVLHAPRQVGKTTLLLALRDYLNQGGAFHCVYTNVENAQAARENVAKGMQAILYGLGSAARTTLDDAFPAEAWPEIMAESGEFAALEETLTRWAAHAAKPLVLLVDEIDSLVGDTLISVLRQLRAGYYKRPGGFPQSVVLCGVRDVRDYRIHSEQSKTIITGGSAFNIKAESLRLGDFTEADVKTLFAQHTEETGQAFEPQSLALVWELTQGQPWLVNALGYEVCFRMPTGRDRGVTIRAEMMMEAKEALILRRETHLDQLADKLQEQRVQRVLLPMLLGKNLARSAKDDDIQYVLDLGLVRRTAQGLQVANPIYHEIIPRTLNQLDQTNFETLVQPAWYVGDDGRLDVEKLLTAFQQFFREHSEHWVERFNYQEVGPQQLLQAFLQRIINGGGRIEREYGLGRGRTDLLILWPYGQGTPRSVQRVVIETKLRRKSLEKTVVDGLAQTWAYMDRCDAQAGHLVIFDRVLASNWEKRIFRRVESWQGHEIVVWGM